MICLHHIRSAHPRRAFFITHLNSSSLKGDVVRLRRQVGQHKSVRTVAPSGGARKHSASGQLLTVSEALTYWTYLCRAGNSNNVVQRVGRWKVRCGRKCDNLKYLFRLYTCNRIVCHRYRSTHNVCPQTTLWPLQCHTNIYKIPSSNAEPSTESHLLVHTMPPDLLLSTSRVGTNPQDLSHLIIANEHDIPRHEEPDTLGARRASETAPVSPELGEVADGIDG